MCHPGSKTHKKRSLGSLHEVERKNVPVLQRYRVHWKLIKSLVELEADSQKRAQVQAPCVIRQRVGRNVGRCSWRQRLQDTVGLCFPPENLQQAIKTPFFSNKRKIYISELTLDKCPFPAGSNLALKFWHLIKQQTAPVNPHSTVFDTCDPSSVSRDEKDKLQKRERRRLGIEEGIESPPNSQIHIFEATAQVNPLYKPGPKLAPE